MAGQRRRKSGGGQGKSRGTRLKRSAPGAGRRKRPAEDPPEEHTLPAIWLKTAVGVILLPVCWVATAALFSVFRGDRSGSLWQSEEVWMFSAGFLLWLPLFFFVPRPTGLYVVGHELTHAVFIRLFGGRIGRIITTREGGYVLTDKNNFLIALAPYFVPFWTLVSLAILGVTALFLEIPWFDRLLFFITGVTWSFHLTFTLDMIRQDQPDITENGRFFSLTFIYLANIIIIAGMLVLASPKVSALQFLAAARDEARGIARTASALLGNR